MKGINTHLGVGQFAALQRRHVAAQSELLAMETLEVLLPLQDLRLDLVARLLVGDNGLLQLGHVLQLVVLQRQSTELVSAYIREGERHRDRAREGEKDSRRLRAWQWRC